MVRLLGCILDSAYQQVMGSIIGGVQFLEVLHCIMLFCYHGHSVFITMYVTMVTLYNHVGYHGYSVYNLITMPVSYHGYSVNHVSYHIYIVYNLMTMYVTVVTLYYPVSHVYVAMVTLYYPVLLPRLQS